MSVAANKETGKTGGAKPWGCLVSFTVHQDIDLVEDCVWLGRGEVRNTALLKKRDRPFFFPCSFFENATQVCHPNSRYLVSEISKQHCSITRKNGRVTVTDTSSNGTFVNGKQLGRGVSTVLAHEDVLSLLVPSADAEAFNPEQVSKNLFFFFFFFFSLSLTHCFFSVGHVSVSQPHGTGDKERSTQVFGGAEKFAQFEKQNVSEQRGAAGDASFRNFRSSGTVSGIERAGRFCAGDESEFKRGNNSSSFGGAKNAKRQLAQIVY